MNKILLARIKAGLSQEELMRRSGLSEPTISAAERGLARPRAQTLHRIAKGLGVPVTELLEEAEIPKVEAPGPDEEEDRALFEDEPEEGVHHHRTGKSHVGRITGSSHVRVEVDVEELRAALHGVAAGWLSAEEAEEKLLAGVA